MEAGLLSPAHMTRFLHNNPQSLERTLARSQAKQKLVVTEGVFSMDGDCAPLQEIQRVSQAHNAMLMVDDAHGCGVLTMDGSGSCKAANIQPDILVITFGKAFGLSGAAVLCNQTTADYLTQFARHYFYSTAMPPAQAHAISKACDMVQHDTWRREKLTELSELLGSQLSSHIDLKKTMTPIEPWMIGSAQQALSIAEKLKQQGCWVSAIREPTVPKNTARLRINLSAAHAKSDIHQLVQAILGALRG